MSKCLNGFLEKIAIHKKVATKLASPMYEPIKTRYNAFSKTENDVSSGMILQFKKLVLQGFHTL